MKKADCLAKRDEALRAADYNAEKAWVIEFKRIDEKGGAK